MTNEVVSLINELPTGQAQIDKFSDWAVEAVKGGSANALQMHTQLKAFIKAADRIVKEIAPEVLTERNLYVESNLLLYGAEISKEVPTKTDYFFEGCNDPEWAKLSKALEDAKTALKAREDFLKVLPGEQTFLDKETGEYYTVKPPVKKQSMGIKVSFK